MRLWSLDPALLDRRALVAGWRETLLAQKVLRGETKGYTRHPQLSASETGRILSSQLRIICTQLRTRQIDAGTPLTAAASHVLVPPTRTSSL